MAISGHKLGSLLFIKPNIRLLSQSWARGDARVIVRPELRGWDKVFHGTVFCYDASHYVERLPIKSVAADKKCEAVKCFFSLLFADAEHFNPI